jgi:hypothetical protein
MSALVLWLSPRCGATDMSPTNSLNSVLLPAPFPPTRATRDVWPSLHETLFKTVLSEPAYLKVRRVRLATVLTLLLQPSRAPGLGKRIAASELPVTCAKYEAFFFCGRAAIRVGLCAAKLLQPPLWYLRVSSVKCRTSVMILPCELTWI